MNTALMFMADNFVGREYFHRLNAVGQTPDLVIEVGRISQKSVDWELRRTGGYWKPEPIPETVERHSFASLKDPQLWALLASRDVDVAIQGGVGILKPDMLAVPKIGFVNVHPGALPAYRGNSCPEWQLHDDKPIVATAHLIDQGIDTGPVITARQMPIQPDWTYEHIRANIYSHCADVLIEALDRLRQWDGSDLSAVATPQIEDNAFYRPQMPPEVLSDLKLRLMNGYDSRNSNE